MHDTHSTSLLLGGSVAANISVVEVEKHGETGMIGFEIVSVYDVIHFAALVCANIIVVAWLLFDLSIISLSGGRRVKVVVNGLSLKCIWHSAEEPLSTGQKDQSSAEGKGICVVLLLEKVWSIAFPRYFLSILFRLCVTWSFSSLSVWTCPK